MKFPNTTNTGLYINHVAIVTAPSTQVLITKLDEQRSTTYY